MVVAPSLLLLIGILQFDAAAGACVDEAVCEICECSSTQKAGGRGQIKCSNIEEGKLPCAAEWKGIASEEIQIKANQLKSIPGDIFSELGACNHMHIDNHPQLKALPEKLFAGLELVNLSVPAHITFCVCCGVYIIYIYSYHD